MKEAPSSYGNRGAEVFQPLKYLLFRKPGISLHFIDLLNMPVTVCRDHQAKLVTVNCSKWHLDNVIPQVLPSRIAIAN